MPHLKATLHGEPHTMAPPLWVPVWRCGGPDSGFWSGGAAGPTKALCQVPAGSCSGHNAAQHINNSLTASRKETFPFVSRKFPKHIWLGARFSQLCCTREGRSSCSVGSHGPPGPGPSNRCCSPPGGHRFDSCGTVDLALSYGHRLDTDPISPFSSQVINRLLGKRGGWGEVNLSVLAVCNSVIPINPSLIRGKMDTKSSSWSSQTGHTHHRGVRMEQVQFQCS